MFLPRNELYEFLKNRNDVSAAFFEDEFWLSKLCYMASIFDHLNQLNLAFQGKGDDIFDVTGKIESMKLKINLWYSNILKGNFSNSPPLENYMKECNWKEKRPELERRIKTTILKHLQLPNKNFGKYFPQSLHQSLENDMWIINPFIADCLKQANLGELVETLIKLHQDFLKERLLKLIVIMGIFGSVCLNLRSITKSL